MYLCEIRVEDRVLLYIIDGPNIHVYRFMNSPGSIQNSQLYICTYEPVYIL